MHGNDQQTRACLLLRRGDRFIHRGGLNGVLTSRLGGVVTLVSRGRRTAVLNELAVELGLLLVRCVGQVDGDFLAEVLGNLFQSQASGLGEEEVDDLGVD